MIIVLRSADGLKAEVTVSDYFNGHYRTVVGPGISRDYYFNGKFELGRPVFEEQAPEVDVLRSYGEKEG